MPGPAECCGVLQFPPGRFSQDIYHNSLPVPQHRVLQQKELRCEVYKFSSKIVYNNFFLQVILRLLGTHLGRSAIYTMCTLLQER